LLESDVDTISHDACPRVIGHLGRLGIEVFHQTGWVLAGPALCVVLLLCKREIGGVIAKALEVLRQKIDITTY
jgi:hypothetical protein